MGSRPLGADPIAILSSVTGFVNRVFRDYDNKGISYHFLATRKHHTMFQKRYIATIEVQRASDVATSEFR